MGQDSIFLQSEGNAWFSRNREALTGSRHYDRPLAMVGRFLSGAAMGRIAEIGCSNGWRLAVLAERFAEASIYGIDASADAVREGKKEWPRLDLRQGLISDLPFKEPFDLVIVNFVLHWVDRASLSRAVAEIDRIVAEGGYLIIGDFMPDAPCKRTYHYLPGRDVYTYKQDYPAIFRALGSYQEISREIFDHDEPASRPITIDPSRRGVCALFKKSASTAYPETQ